MEDNIINNWLKCYLVGPMEVVANGDGGRGWRERISESLGKRIDKNGNSIYRFNPCEEEQNKIDMDRKHFTKK